MIRYYVVIVSCFLLLSSCAGVFDASSDGAASHEARFVESGAAGSPVIEGKEYDEEAIARTIRRASFEFYNACIYREPDSWKGRTVCLLGTYPGTSARSRQFVYGDKEFFLQGSYNGHPVAVVVALDHSLPMQVSYDKAVPRISPLQELYVFGTLRGTENYMNESGFSRALPVLKCLLIYDKDDYSFRHPLWVSSGFERIPEGTVTVDSLKYEFDRPKPR